MRCGLCAVGVQALAELEELADTTCDGFFELVKIAISKVLGSTREYPSSRPVPGRRGVA
jgi:hypothetical protein